VNRILVDRGWSRGSYYDMIVASGLGDGVYTRRREKGRQKDVKLQSSSYIKEIA
jgi:hypothetical protein